MSTLSTIQLAPRPFSKLRQPVLRIAMVASSLHRAGAEKQFVYMAGAMHQARVDVRVFYCGTGGAYERTLRAMGVRVCETNHARQPFRILWALVRALREFRPHIVMASQFSEIIHAGIPGRMFGAMTIAGVRSDGFYEMNRARFRRALMRRLPHALLANSYNAQKNLVFLGVSSEKIKVLQNVIDLADFDRQSAQPVRLPSRPGRILVAAVGRLHTEKCFDRLVDAVALVPGSIPPVTVLIVGRDQGAKASLERKAKALGLPSDRLVFMGESDNVPAILKRCHMLVLSSDYEGFPNAILEAMAARLPVITTPAGDSPRVVQNGRTGFVVGFDDIQGMAGRIAELASSTDLRQALGAAGRRSVENQYDIGSLSDRLFTVLRELADQEERPALISILDRCHPASTLQL